MEIQKRIGKTIGAILKGDVGLWKKGSAGTKAAMVIILLTVVLAVILGSRVLFVTGGRTTTLGLKDIGELATQAGYYTNVEVIEGSKELWGWSVPFTQSKYIFSYDGMIKAGIDFSEVEVLVNELTQTITVRIPPIRILSNEIAADSLEVYDESRSIFTPLTLDTVNMAQGELKKEAEETAIENGLLENARMNAEMLIKGFLAGAYDLEKYKLNFE